MRLRRPLLLVCWLLLTGSSRLALGQWVDPWDPTLFANNSWGSRGAYHLHAARAVRPGLLAMTVGQAVAQGADLFVSGDRDTQLALRIAALWSPMEGIEIAATQVSLVERYEALLPSQLQVQGNPSFLIKYVEPLDVTYGAGGYLQLTVPTSAGGRGFTPQAATLRVAALASYRPGPRVEVSGNLGYIYDRSGTLLSPTTPDLIRYVYGIDRSMHRAHYGVSAVGEWVAGEHAGLAPFAEVWGEVAPGLPMSRNPLAATVGLKLYPYESRTVEATLGADWRLTGAPTAGGKPAGLPAWTAFAQLSLRVGDTQPPRDRVWVPRCDPANPCAPGHECEGIACVRVKEVFHETEKIVERDPEIVTLHGAVFDGDTGQPLAGAKVGMSGQKNTLSVDSDTGAFNLCPLVAGEGLVKVTAEALGYRSEDVTVPRTKASAEQPLTFHLQATGKTVLGTLRGNVKDGVTCQTLANVTVVVPAASIKASVGPDGTFEAKVPEGRYQVLVAAPGYETQKKNIAISVKDVVILNVDLQPKAKGGRTKKGR
ncbi:MAG TPA: carboxypeptidase regulatory-like domain-containing protein [Myxococcota bacterium]|nr:carboxypeptidase regulatory-like domain-containing protein [Myxococcota bacterium]